MESRPNHLGFYILVQMWDVCMCSPKVFLYLSVFRMKLLLYLA